MTPELVLHRTQRATLLRDSEGAIVVVSPKGNRYPVTPTKPELFSIAAVWLGMTDGQLLEFAPAEVLRP